jgi:hypothetical protein
MSSNSYQDRVEALCIKGMEENLRKYEIERETAEVYLETARMLQRNVIARHQQDVTEAEQRIKLAEVSVQNYREFQRPSRLHGISIRQDMATGKWVAELDGVRAEGDTPEMAADEFDHLYVFGVDGK